MLSEGPGHQRIVHVDKSKGRVAIMEPQPQATMTLGRDAKTQLKTFNFDAAYPQESSQVRFFVRHSSGTFCVSSSIRCILSHPYTMVGFRSLSDDLKAHWAWVASTITLSINYTPALLTVSRPRGIY